MSLTRDMMSRQDLLVALDEMEKLYAAGCAAWNPVYKEVLDDRDRLTARVEELEGALKAMVHAVCGPTGFAEAVRHNSGLAYPWPALDDAEALARAAISKGEREG